MVKLGFNSMLANSFIILVFILSFRAFAGFLAPDFDADQAVHILMASDLRLPEDLYYWGQSRLGSLLPILSHWLRAISPLTPIEAVSLVQYFFVTIGFFCFASLFKKTISRVIFALIWFLPPEPFRKLVEVAHPYAPQLALLGIALVCTNQLMGISETRSLKKLILSLIITSSLVLSVWVSDLSIIPALLALTVFLRAFTRRLSLKNLHFSKSSSIYICVFLGLFLWGCFLIYAKLNASQEDVNYGLLEINGLDIITQIIQRILATVGSTLLFQAGSPAVSLYAIASFILLVLLTRYFLQERRNPDFTAKVRWIPFLLISAIGTFFLILLSRWTYIQETPPRYFIGIYLFGWLSALLVFDNLHVNLISRAALRRISILLVLTALLGSLSLPAYVFAIEKPQSRLSMLQPLASLGNVGFIGDYWASYLLCIVAPERLSCTPHDQDFARCLRCVENVLASPLIYLVDRDWLDSLPDEIEQFGQRLQKQGPAEQIAGYWMAPYRNIDRLK